jgi:hypothetical protein
VREYRKNKQEPERDRRNNEVGKEHALDNVRQRCPPILRRRLPVLDQALRHRCLRHQNAELSQLPMNARSTPTQVGLAHSPDEIGNFTRYRRAACGMAALPPPIQPESLSMPANGGLRLYDHQCGSPVCPQPGQPNPQQAVRSAQTNAVAMVGALQNHELMA